MTRAQYHLVGCRDCHELWIRDRSEDRRSTRTDCPRCGTSHDVRRLRAFETAADPRRLWASRGRLLATRAGQEKLFEADMAVLRDRGNAVATDDDLFYPVLDTGEAWFADGAARVQSFYNGFQTADDWWQAEMRERRQANDRAYADQFEADADRFEALVDAEADAAEPAWNAPEFTVTFPGGQAPVGATLTVGPRVSEWAGDLLEQLVAPVARAVRNHLRSRVRSAPSAGASASALEAEHAYLLAPSVVRTVLVEEAGITALGG